MRSYDLSPLFRSTVGFDRMTRLLENALSGEENGNNTYPPYNIEKRGDDQYRVTMAIAGFSINDLEITAHPNLLIVQGKAKEAENTVFLHRGIAGRAFERRFQLADHIRVSSANLENGLLHIDLVREIPETMKPRSIQITTQTAPASLPTLEAA